MKRICEIIATVFYVGYIPFAPGTMGSLAGLCYYFLVRNNRMVFLVSIAFFFIMGLIAAAGARSIFKKRDPGEIVIDEFTAILVVLFFVPSSPVYIAVSFLFFRFFDIIKVPPIKKIDSMTGPFFIMLDDMVAAFYALMLTAFLSKCIS